MTTTTTTGYAEAVRQALDDLPPAAVSELVEGLDEHLAEVGVADLVSLFALLGSPERYAADLRASAGLPPRAATTPSPPLPPPVLPPPVARPSFAIRGRHLARLALAVSAVATLLLLAAAKNTVDPIVVLVIVIAVGAGALLLRWLYRVADLPARWATGAPVALAALALAVAVAAGAGHPRDNYTPYPYPFGAPTTVGGSVMLDLIGVETPIAVEILQKMGLIPVVTGRADSASAIVSQDPPPGQYVAPGQPVHLITNRPDEPAPPFAPIPATTTPSVGTTPTTPG